MTAIFFVKLSTIKFISTNSFPHTPAFFRGIFCLMLTLGDNDVRGRWHDFFIILINLILWIS